MKLAIVESQLSQMRVSQAEREITKPQTVGFYRQHQSLFWVPEVRDYNIIEAYKKSAIEQALREVRMGQSFKRVAERLTIDPVAPTGIRVDYTRGDGSRRLDHAIFGAKLGVLEGPKKITTYWIFKVIRIRRAHEQSLTQASTTIRRRLAGEIASTTLASESRRRWASRTACPKGPLRSTCWHYIHSF